MNFSNVFQALQNYYFGEILLGIVELMFIFIALRFLRHSKIARLFIFYLALDFCILLLLWLLNLGVKIAGIISIGNTVTTFIELFVYCYYFKVILDKRFNKYLDRLFISYLLLMLIYLITHFSFLSQRLKYISNLMSVLEFLLLLPFCFRYYFQILNTNSEFKVVERPSFWIVTGIFAFSLISIPYYLLMDYMALAKYSQHQLRLFSFLFYYIPFIINILFLIKAVLCKKPLSI